MEETHLELFHEAYGEDALRQIPTLTLAHIGDGVYELLARSHVVSQGAVRVEEAHKKTVALVAAPAQAKAAEALLPLLDEWEESLFHRGRNVRPHSVPKHCAPRDYAYATGLETLFGGLYLAGRTQRLQDLWQAALEALK